MTSMNSHEIDKTDIVANIFESQRINEDVLLLLSDKTR